MLLITPIIALALFTFFVGKWAIKQDVQRRYSRREHYLDALVFGIFILITIAIGALGLFCFLRDMM